MAGQSSAVYRVVRVLDRAVKGGWAARYVGAFGVDGNGLGGQKDVGIGYGRR